MFLPLPFAFCLYLVLAGFAVSDCGLSVLQASVSVLLGDPFSLCTQVCRYSLETSSLEVVFVYVALWPRISSGWRRKSEDSCPRLLLGSCVLRVSRCSPEQQAWSYLCSLASPPPVWSAISLHHLDMTLCDRGCIIIIITISLAN